MSPRIFSCVLCGYIILNYEDPSFASWENQFRLRKCEIARHSSQELS